MIRPIFLAALISMACAAQAQDSYIIHAGQALLGSEQKLQGPVYLWIEAGKIKAIDPQLSGLSAPELPLLDWREFTVLPGLIDCHVHLVSDKAGIESQLAGVTDSAPAQTLDAVVNARKTLAAGFTTVRNLGDGRGVVLALRDGIEAGKIPGPRIFDAGRSISVTSGHMDGRLGFREELHQAIGDSQLCDGADECRKTVRRQIGRGVDWIKIATTGGVNSRIGAGVGQQMFSDEARAIIDTAHLAGKKVAVHAHGQDGIRVALDAGADSIEHGTIMDLDTIKLMKQTGTYLVATMSTINGYQERLAANPNAYSKAVLEKIQWRIGVTGKAFKLAHDNGVKIAFGTDAGVSLHGRNADEFELMVKYGMTPAEAIRAATLNAAMLLGIESQAGSLQADKAADLIAVKGNPLEDVKVLKQVQWVVARGQVHETAELLGVGK